MSTDKIIIKGARAHNLKNIDLELPRNKLIVITGLSGSGKSSLAFDTLYAEGQRRYVESLSAYARQFLGQMDKPDVEYIEGLSPAISIEQKSTSKNPRSTVGTVTEIYDYLRLLYARIGKQHCPSCKSEIAPQTVEQIVQRLMALPSGTKIHVLAPLARQRKGEYKQMFEALAQSGFSRVRVDGRMYALSEEINLNKQQKHDIDVVVDRLVIKQGIEERLADSVATALREGSGILVVDIPESKELLFSEHAACARCGISFEPLEPNMFSFNSPRGACPSCQGLGSTMEFDPDLIIPDKSRSISQGAVEPWGYEYGYYRQMLQSVANHYGFSLDTPFSDLNPEHVQVILHGGSEQIHFRYVPRDRDGFWEHWSSFEGVIPHLARKHRESQSEESREKIQQYMSIKPCTVCNGERLKPSSLAVTIEGRSIISISRLSVRAAREFLENINFTEKDAIISKPIFKELKARLGFLMDVGLDYLTLDRAAGTLSGGESQRIRLATQIGSSLVGVLYILDEPSIGLHQRDNGRLIRMLTQLRDLGNTVIVVEHDEEMIRSADFIVDMGPGAGVHGGEIVVTGSQEDVIGCERSLTGKYLCHKAVIQVPDKRRKPVSEIMIIGAGENNLKQIDVHIPLGVMTCVTGVSGSGKSTLVNDILYKALAQKFYHAKEKPGRHRGIIGSEKIDKIIIIDQSPIGRTPRSNPATYTGVFTPVRELFAKLPSSRARGYMPGRFSFNVKGGRCEACQGDGIITIEMHFLPDVYVPCEVCRGKRFNSETLEILYKDKNIAQVLDMTVEEALAFFENIPRIKRPLQTIFDIGLGYIRLGQSATTLSGGEAQRIKLATELTKRNTGRTLYILDEPTTGLHFADIQKLLDMLSLLVDAGNSVVVIEHNLDVIKVADHIIDLGPEGGDNGGRIIAEGTPEKVAKIEGSYTGYYLKKILNA
ncbi:Excinuclease ABC subunit A [Candidatus Methanoperedens nitroreducens]|uniref:UvrABC system protein A n=1 Tax=Candidatus Methanoperedens nitratireducens TaxID=1392998 RepID=A0A062VBZ9_9EURY|nr:excinuclease ABC subunit UvrA [Candidatus Methanoperedens nitroreducens]KCZ72820.1 Excinuclease ABC subunit A [Candidatus Methanoperedens nitroreducens]MDJ1423249.1 excinuclease ABC subunit UvrA [Candidatus Methanoperedens sp.]